ncbi:MAG TPA: Gfo/Idh/MocA family oxidoreductase [Bryobacteraceae bacterium]|nr:Gfo/Idh/MocA family oxidoreductase [Bryobacteraceae bacterium]
MQHRRSFLQSAAALTALSQSRILGANDRVRLGAIGTGGRMRGLLTYLSHISGNELVALCDVYEPRRAAAREKFSPQAHEYTDYRELLANHDIDAVVIAAPDHWHVQMAVDALAAGKDVYLEKPVTHTIEQGDVLKSAVAGSHQVLQCGMQQRSWAHYQSAHDIVAGGQLGKITLALSYWYQNYQRVLTMKPDIDPSKLDWRRWLGSAPEQPFDPLRYLFWRWYWDFGGGALTDLFCHWVDVIQWAMNSDMPSAAQAMGDRYVITQWECPDTINASYQYPGFAVVYNGTMIGSLEGGGIVFRGTKAMMKLTRDGFAVYPEGVIHPEKTQMPDPTIQMQSAEDGTIAHLRNFLDCVRSRATPNAPVEAGVAAARAAHIGNRALRERKRVDV